MVGDGARGGQVTLRLNAGITANTVYHGKPSL